MVKVKGNQIFHFRETIKQELGEERYKEFFEILDEETKRILKDPIISSEMYDINILRDIFKKVVQINDEQTLLKISEKEGEKQL